MAVAGGSGIKDQEVVRAHRSEEKSSNGGIRIILSSNCSVDKHAESERGGEYRGIKGGEDSMYTTSSKANGHGCKELRQMSFVRNSRAKSVGVSIEISHF